MTLTEIRQMNATLARMAAAPADEQWAIFLGAIEPGARQARVDRIAASITTAEPTLPACRGFTGAGRRCATCKIHRNIHN